MKSWPFVGSLGSLGSLGQSWAITDVVSDLIGCDLMEDFEVTGVMIDRPGSTDRDDAFAVRRVDAGWEVYVHVADAARQVAVGGDLDRTARERVRSRYLSDRTIRMLSSQTEQQAALVPGEAKKTIRFGLEYDSNGVLQRIGVTPSELRQPIAMSYEEAARAIGDPSHPQHAQLADAHGLAGALLARRRAGGALAVYAIAHGWATDEEGNVVRLGVNERNAGYIVVQELMIAANAAAAQWCAEREIPILFRNHRVSAVAPPRNELLDDLDAVEADPIGARLDAVSERMSLLQRPAVYAPHIAGHYGLNLPAYTHATSPLRRYPDLVNQRILLAVAAGEPSPYSADELEQLGEEITSRLVEFREQRAEHFRAAAKAETLRRVADSGLSNSSAEDLHKVVDAAVAAGPPPEDLTAELLRRIDGRSLPPRDACSVLFFTDDAWQVVQDAVLEWITDEPAHAISLLTMYASIEGLGQVEWTLENVGTADGPAVFAARATLGSEQSPRRLAGSKRESKQQAALGFVAAIADLDDPSRDLATPGAGRVAPPPMKLPEIPHDQNPTMTVYQLIQLGILVDVEWSFESAGSSHEPRHTCRVVALDGRTGDEVTAKGSAGTKASAKATAASVLLEQLRARVIE